MNKKDEFVSRYRAFVTALLSNLDGLRALRLEFDSLGYSGNINSTDLEGQNPDVTPQQVSDAVASIGAVETLLGTGHFTNLYRVKKTP